MTDGAEGEFWLTNAGIKDTATADVVDVNTSTSCRCRPTSTATIEILPTEAALAGDAAFDGNNYGVWRGRNSQYNTVYYNPQIAVQAVGRSEPQQRRLSRTSSPTAAPLDPYDAADSDDQSD